MMRSGVFFVFLAAVAACVPSTPVVQTHPAAPIVVNNWTRPYRWSRRQSTRLAVYVTPTADAARQATCDSLVDRALAAWSDDGPVSIVRTTRQEAADVRIVWTQSLPAQHPGVTMLKPNRRGELIAADVFIMTTVPARGDISSDRVLYGVLAHEIGHALGLPHAPQQGRIMNEVLHTLDITPADIASLREIRSSGL